MRLPLLVFVVAVAVAVAQTPDTREYQQAVCPSTPLLELAPSSEHWFEGSMGRRQVRMHLERGGDAVVGVFYDTANWVPLILGGRWSNGDAIEAAGRTEDDVVAGQLHGRISASGFMGSWTPKGRAGTEQVRMKRVPQPQCEHYAGAWRQFSDPRWPVTFSYPASWRLERGDESITLTCPDPSAMAYSDFNIRITQGSTGDEGAGSFTRCAGEWKYGRQCECDNLDACETAEIQEVNGMTVLGGDNMEWRIYCRNGGYVASGFGVDRLILIGDRWFDLSGEGPPSELIETILKTVRRR
jgi:hypothetical protein